MIMNRQRNGKNWQQFPGKAPISKERLLRHYRGEGVDLKPRTTRIKSQVHREHLKKKERIIERLTEQATRAELLLTEDYGCLEADDGEATTQFTQKQIAANVDITSATKHFNLDLDFGPYCLRYTRNGRHLVLGGKRGHVAAFDWVTKKLSCEINVMESVHDVAWLHIETMFAVAQKEWVYIYDNQGIEIHCMKNMNGATRLEFLPYHFLLASGSETGYLVWLDVSIGQIISRINSKVGPISVMTQNPSNAILCVGSPNGVVSMWSPNSHEPVSKMLCHKQAISACAVHPQGTYMATGCPDRTLKVWDVRQLSGPVHNALLRSAAYNLSYSQRGLLSVAMGNVVEVYRESTKGLKTYMKHTAAWGVSGIRFCPYEDVLGVGTGKGFTSLLIPGSAEANYDALEANPFQNKSQRQQAEVKALLDKIQPELITLDPTVIAEVDVPTLKERIEAKKKLLFMKPKPIDFRPRKTKAKGKGGTAQVIKTKKILKDLSRRETIDIVREAKVILPNANKQYIESKDYGILNRFLQKGKKDNNANSGV